MNNPRCRSKECVILPARCSDIYTVRAAVRGIQPDIHGIPPLKIGIKCKRLYGAFADCRYHTAFKILCFVGDSSPLVVVKLVSNGTFRLKLILKVTKENFFSSIAIYCTKKDDRFAIASLSSVNPPKCRFLYFDS